MLSRIVSDYLSGHAQLKPFYTFNPDLSSFNGAISARNFPAASREVLVKTLRAQYRSLGVDEGYVTQYIDPLLDSNTYTITTGHQLCLFTGPAYFIYKILSVIRTAQALSELHPDKRFVPVFWAASEDHDFAEVNHAHIGGRTFTWELDSAARPVGRIPTASLASLLDEMKPLFTGPRMEELHTLFCNAYLGSTDLSEATRKIVHHLFSKYGLVVIEPDDAGLKKMFTPAIKKDVLEHAGHTAIEETNRELGPQYKLQIHGREVNFFYLSERGRVLIERDRNSFKAGELIFTREEMESEIDAHPERFSPNVMMRPVYQEQILPNLAYVGGPGELAYWLQLKRVFEAFNTFYPVVLLRHSFMLLTQPQVRQIARAGLQPADLFASPDAIRQRMTDHASGVDLRITQLEASIHLQELVDRLGKVDTALVSKVIAHKKHHLEFLNELRKDVRQAVGQRDQLLWNKVLKVRETLFPTGVPQERYENYASLQMLQYEALTDSIFSMMPAHAENMHLIII